MINCRTDKEIIIPSKIGASAVKLTCTNTKNGSSFLLNRMQLPINVTTMVTNDCGIANFFSRTRLLMIYYVSKPLIDAIKKITLDNSELLCFLSSISKRGK